MNKAAANSLAYWLLKTHPELFAHILKTTHPGMAGLGQSDLLPLIDTTPVDPNVDLSPIGFSSINAVSLPDVTVNTSAPGFFSSLGSGIESAVTSVGSALTNPSVLNSFANAASNYFKAQGTTAQANAQTAVLNAQLQRARAGLPAAPISYTATGQPIYSPSPTQPIPGLFAQSQPVGTPGSSFFGYPVTPSNISALHPSFFQQYGLWLAIGGAVLAAAFLLSSRASRR